MTQRPVLLCRWASLAAVFILCFGLTSRAQTQTGVIAGIVTDATGAALPHAQVTLDPPVSPASTDGQGAFTITNVHPGTYAVTISYQGFAPYSGSVTVAAGHAAQIKAVLKVASASDSVVVTAPRLFGSAQAINQVLSSDNLVDVLPAKVITSLPNANVADALERMAGISVERDEGEAKYVQIRGTEPRLSNVMIDGITVPSPESGVRQIKLDTIASDLVSEIVVNKTLRANMDADGIGGSVNLVTRTASDTPTLSIFDSSGYTPIDNGRTASMVGATLGKRFGPGKKLGALLAGTYDFNGRGINDMEPVPTAGDATPHFDSADFRNYVYDRTRWGLAGSVDYKLGSGSDIALRGIYTNFRNWGVDYIHTVNDGAFPNMSHSWRRPNMAIASLDLSARHQFRSSWLTWTAAVSRSRDEGGYGGDSYSWVGDQNLNCVNDQSVAASIYRPGWSGCFGNGLDNVVDSNNYGFTEDDLPSSGHTAQLNLQGAASFGKQYHVGNRYGALEFGAKVRNAHKFDDTSNVWYTTPAYSASDPEPVVNGQTLQLSDGDPVPVAVSAHSEWADNFRNPGYYDGTYPAGTFTSYPKVHQWVMQNKGQLVYHNDHDPTLPNASSDYSLANNFDLIERVPAGYVMNTFDFTGHIRLVAGVRIEATHVSTLSWDGIATSLTYKAGGDYTDVMPNAELRFALDANSDLRLVYSRGLSRPDPQDISAAASLTLNQNPVQVGLGNPALKAEMANDYDVLYERTFPHVGLLQAGYFYKDLTNPIASFLITTTGTDTRIPAEFRSRIPAGSAVQISQPINAGSAAVQGIELSFQQRLSYLPGVLGGAGIAANYSYTSSVARDIPGRSDQPALLRDSPNVWNIGPTYDTRRFSMRIGMNFQSAQIYQYQWQDGADPTGIRGPSGDNYLYPHYQFDTQATYQLPRGFSVFAYGLNLNNEVFGFYNGSPQYLVQREYYQPTYAGGIRWDLARER
jgi:TonB-dependent receptor